MTVESIILSLACYTSIFSKAKIRNICSIASIGNLLEETSVSRNGLAWVICWTGNENQNKQVSASLSHSLILTPSLAPAAGESPVPWGILADSQPGWRWRSGSVYSGGDWIKKQEQASGGINSLHQAGSASLEAGLGCVNQPPTRALPLGSLSPWGLQQTVSINSLQSTVISHLLRDTWQQRPYCSGFHRLLPAISWHWDGSFGSAMEKSRDTPEPVPLHPGDSTQEWHQLIRIPSMW